MFSTKLARRSLDTPSDLIADVWIFGDYSRFGRCQPEGRAHAKVQITKSFPKLPAFQTVPCLSLIVKTNLDLDSRWKVTTDMILAHLCLFQQQLRSYCFSNFFHHDIFSKSQLQRRMLCNLCSATYVEARATLSEPKSLVYLGLVKIFAQNSTGREG